MKQLPSERIHEIESFLNEHFDIRYNTISNQVEYKGKDQRAFSALNENNFYRILRLNDIKASIHEIHILLNSDYVLKYNPISSYFSRISSLWDGSIHGDYIAYLANFLTIERKNQFIKHLKKWMIRSIVCGYNSTYYNKQAFILVGEKQNTGKSSFLRFLCPPELFEYMSENISTDKDGLIALCENFLINMDELSTMSRQEINSLKSIFSKDRVKVRLPYERRASTLPRVASFMGSTNKFQFLNDETGSVRFINFEVDRIDWSYSRAVDINIAWSQAYQLWQSNYSYELSSAEIEENELINNQYKISTPELELILKYFTPGTKDEYQYFWTASELLNYLLEQNTIRIRLSIINLGKALKMAGFTQGQKRMENFPVKGYYIFIKNTN